MAIFGIYYAFNNITGNTIYNYQRNMGLFCSSIVFILWGIAMYFRNSKIFYSVSASLTVLLCISATIYMISVPAVIRLGNYSHYSWSKSFKLSLDELERAYVLRDWKEIDFDELRSELCPRIEEAEKNNDIEEFARVLYDLEYSMHDGHFYIGFKDTSLRENIRTELAGNDYGLSMFRDNTGNVLAVLVDEFCEASDKGIKNGTKIIKWDDKPIEDALASVKCKDGYYYYVTIENEEIFKPVYLAGKGGDKVNITFIDDQNNEKTVSVSKIGNYYSRLRKAVNKINNASIIENENFKTKMLNSNCGYLRITTEEMSFTSISEITATFKGVYPELREQLNNQIIELENQGMDRIIIDIRNNNGGYDAVCNTVTSLFVDEKLVMGYSKYKNGEYIFYNQPKKYGDVKWNNIPVVVLVNNETCSCAERIAYYFSQRENTALIGNTYTWGSAQTLGGVCLLSDSMFYIQYPLNLALSNEKVLISDVQKDRIARISLDYQITYDKEGVINLFSDSKEDIVLNKALDYIEKMK